jgi:hypothetical protein
MDRPEREDAAGKGRGGAEIESEYGAEWLCGRG